MMRHCIQLLDVKPCVTQFPMKPVIDNISPVDAAILDFFRIPHPIAAAIET